MYFMTNKINFNEIFNKFDKFYNNLHIIKIKIINKIK